MGTKINTKFVVQFGWKHVDFWKAEFDSVLTLNNLSPEDVYNEEHLTLGNKSPFLFVNFPSIDVAKQVSSRCVLITRVYQYWGHGKTDAALHQAIKGLDPAFTASSYSEACSWCIQVGAFGKKLKMHDQKTLRDKLAFIPFKGPVKLKEPDRTFWYLEEYTQVGVKCNTADERVPRCKYFLLEISSGRADLVQKYTLKKRQFLGPTSMDTELSFIMSNCVLARSGSFIIDPFVGTGSLLISAKAFGAHCVGVDIDIRILHAKRFNKTSDQFSNYDQYGFSPPCTLRADVSRRGNCLRKVPIFDGILCDPPYGVRAGARKCGSKRKTIEKIPDHKLKDHIPKTQPYHGTEVMLDLLEMAATFLVVGGRLVYFLPVERAIYTDADIPRHECLKLVFNCEDPLGSFYSRRMITMEKTKEYPVESGGIEGKRMAYYTDGREFQQEQELTLRQKMDNKGLEKKRKTASSAEGLVNAASKDKKIRGTQAGK